MPTFVKSDIGIKSLGTML